MKTLIIYNSQHGTTKRYANEIFEYIKDNGDEASIKSIDEFNEKNLNEYDTVLLGTWTQGLFFFAQKPDKKWKSFSKSFPQLNDKKIGLFTTYKVATGSFYKNMAKSVNLNIKNVQFTLKSKKGDLSEGDLEILKTIIL